MPLPLRPAQKSRGSDQGSLIGIVVVVFILYLVLSWLAGHLQTMVLGMYVLGSTASFVAYSLDKSAAAHGNWRVKESTLHWIDVFCGWPGGYAAQRILRHKTVKSSFATVFLLTIVVNISVLVLYASPMLRHATLKLAGFE